MTREGTLWLRDSKSGRQLPLAAPSGQPAALSVSDVQFSGSEQHVDIILTTSVANTAELYRRVLKISPTVAFDGPWSDWAATTDRGARYVPATVDRTVLEVSKAFVGGLFVYYCSAVAGSESWGSWNSIPALPGGAEPRFLAGTPWFENDLTPKQWAAIVTASDGRIYLTSTDAPKAQPWASLALGKTTVPASIGLGVAVSGHPIVLAVAAEKIWIGEAWIKENTLNRHDSALPGQGVRLLAPYVFGGGACALIADQIGLDLRSLNLDAEGSFGRESSASQPRSAGGKRNPVT